MISKIAKSTVCRINFYGSRSLIPSVRYLISQPETPKQQRFLRFIDFDTQYFDTVPYIFKPLDPLMISTKEAIVSMNSFANMPWWLVLILTSVFVRLTIFPLVMIQMKRTVKLAPISPVFVMIKDTWKKSDMSLFQRIRAVWGIYRQVSKRKKFRISTIFVYNIAYYPLLISMIYAVRKLLADPSVSGTTFLHLNNLGQIDPYFILPTLTIGLYYWNFERFITPENRNTLISRIRIGCQYFLIAWFPFLCCWPSGIVLYMTTNAFISIIQSNILKAPWFLSKVTPEQLYYNLMLTTVQYDKGSSDSVIESIKTGEEIFGPKKIKEGVLFEQVNQMVKKLNQGVQDQRALQIESRKQNIGKNDSV